MTNTNKRPSDDTNLESSRKKPKRRGTLSRHTNTYGIPITIRTGLDISTGFSAVHPTEESLWTHENTDEHRPRFCDSMDPPVLNAPASSRRSLAGRVGDYFDRIRDVASVHGVDDLPYRVEALCLLESYIAAVNLMALDCQTQEDFDALREHIRFDLGTPQRQWEMTKDLLDEIEMEVDAEMAQETPRWFREGPPSSFGEYGVLGTGPLPSLKDNEVGSAMAMDMDIGVGEESEDLTADPWPWAQSPVPPLSLGEPLIPIKESLGLLSSSSSKLDLCHILPDSEDDTDEGEGEGEGEDKDEDDEETEEGARHAIDFRKLRDNSVKILRRYTNPDADSDEEPTSEELMNLEKDLEKAGFWG